MTAGWQETLATALVGTARSGGDAESVVDAAAALALRRRAGTALVPAVEPGEPSPPEDAPTVGPAAAARVDDLLALDSVTRNSGPVRDAAGRLALLAEWLCAAAAAKRRLPPELAPALLDAGRRHPELRPWIAPVAGRLAGWLATQRVDWSYAAPAVAADPSTVDDGDRDDVGVWEFGSTAQRVAYLRRLRERDTGAGRALLDGAWSAEPPQERAALLTALDIGLSALDEPLLERALDDRLGQVREAGLRLLARLPVGGYADRMVARALACVDLSGTGTIAVTPPLECDRSMRRDGITARPPVGTGARAFWLEEILARTPLRAWPAPEVFAARGVEEEWVDPVRRGLARAAAAQQDGAWAAALVDAVTADLAEHGHPAGRQLLAELLGALPADDLAARATAGLRAGLGSAAAVGVEQMLALCPRPWPPAVADAVLAALDQRLGDAAAPAPVGRARVPAGPAPAQVARAEFSGNWRLAGICDLAAFRLPADATQPALVMARRWWTRLNDAPREGGRTIDPATVIVERFAATLRYRRDMHEELSL